MLLTSFEERTVFWLLKHIDGIQTGLVTSRLLEQNKNYMSTDVLVHTLITRIWKIFPKTVAFGAWSWIVFHYVSKKLNFEITGIKSYTYYSGCNSICILVVVVCIINLKCDEIPQAVWVVHH